MITIKHCDNADNDHSKKCRRYAHTFHRKDVICIASAFRKLPDPWRTAILLHEIGHLIAGRRGNENAANEAIKDVTGIKITYRDSSYGKHLEYIRPSLLTHAHKFLRGIIK